MARAEPGAKPLGVISIIRGLGLVGRCLLHTASDAPLIARSIPRYHCVLGKGYTICKSRRMSGSDGS